MVHLGGSGGGQGGGMSYLMALQGIATLVLKGHLRGLADREPARHFFSPVPQFACYTSAMHESLPSSVKYSFTLSWTGRC